jgi:SAM-dependent methyltransferase
VKNNLTREEVAGRCVLEVGSLDVNGSVRPMIKALRPDCYIGIDIQLGPGVDEICDASDILSRFGENRFELLISTELLEHVRDWREVVSNFKHVLKPGGLLLITTRSRDFGYHGYPLDYWRFELSDMKEIFSDFIIEAVEPDLMTPGVFLKARKPEFFLEKDTKELYLFSILTGNRRQRVGILNIILLRLRFRVSPVLSSILPPRMKVLLKRLYNRAQEL